MLNNLVPFKRMWHMSWLTASDNTHAQRFYEKMGDSLGNWLNYSI